MIFFFFFIFASSFVFFFQLFFGIAFTLYIIFITFCLSLPLLLIICLSFSFTFLLQALFLYLIYYIFVFYYEIHLSSSCISTFLLSLFFSAPLSTFPHTHFSYTQAAQLNGPGSLHALTTKISHQQFNECKTARAWSCSAFSIQCMSSIFCLYEQNRTRDRNNFSVSLSG